jgi:hypothetical protein
MSSPVGDAHLADRAANFQRHGWSTAAKSRFPPPIQFETGALPAHHGIGSDKATVSYILGNSRQTPPKMSLSIDPNGRLLGLARLSTLICCLSTKISARALRATVAGRSPSQTSVCTNLTSSRSLARFPISRQRIVFTIGQVRLRRCRVACSASVSPRCCPATACARLRTTQ